MVKILVVDDSLTARSLVKQSLAAGHYQIVEAESGLDGIRVFSENKDIALIISDLNMPSMDGLSMCEKIQGSAEKKIPILMITADPALNHKVVAKSAGVVVWLVKPFEPTSLANCVEKILKSRMLI